jgi:hypothetical protein
MIEEEWLDSDDPTLMLELFRQGNAPLMSVRKRRLFACACCRRIAIYSMGRDCVG